MPLAEQPPLPGGLEVLPLPLYVFVRVCLVGPLVIYQESQQFVGLDPRTLVLDDQALACLYELLLPNLLQVLPLVPLEPQLLLGLKLNRVPLVLHPSSRSLG